MKKGTKLYSILKFKCPECQEGDFFEGFFMKGSVKNECSKCNAKYSKEPGFYQGSYYVVYALSVAVFVTTWVSLNLFFKDLNYTVLMLSIISAILLTAPFMYPLSKIIWANFFIHYTPNKNTND